MMQHFKNGIFQDVLDKGLSVRQVEELVRNGNQKPAAKQKNSASVPLSFGQQKVREDLENQLGTRIQISKQSSGGGKIVITYNSDSDFQRIAELLGV